MRTQEIIDKYLKYDTIAAVKEQLNRIYAPGSTKDELIEREHLDKLTLLLPEDRSVIVDDFGQ